MSKRHFHGNRTLKIAIFTLLGISALAGFTVYAVTSQVINDYILRIAGAYANIDNIKQYYDQVANEKQLSADGRKDYYSTISKVHKGVADIHMRISNFADERYGEAGGTTPINTCTTGTCSESTGSTQEPITNSFLQVQFYGVPYGANSRGTLTRGKDYDGYYGLSNKIPEEGPFVCKAWYSTSKDKTRGREINFTTDNSVSNTSAKKSDSLMMKIDFASDVTETLLKVSCSGTMGGNWKTLEYNETFTVVAPGKAVIAYFQVSNTNPAPNESLTFSWQTTSAVGCTLIQLADGGVRFSLPGQVANGSFDRNADGSGRSTYRLVCTNAIGEDVNATDIDVVVKTPGTGGDTPTTLSCGTAKDQNFTSAPNTNLCIAGTPSPSPAAVDPANASKWKWTCSLGTQNITCSANKTSTNQDPTNTIQCGTAINSSFSTAPTSNLCIQSTNPAAPTLSTATNKWNWTCGTGTNSVNCSANYTTVSTVTCGTSNNGSFASAPTTNLCIQSTANPAVPVLNTTTNKWGWNCTSGNQNITCSASKTTTPSQPGTTGPKCGGVNNGMYINAPTNQLCETGTPQPTVPTLDTATNKWKWSCSASGATIDCSARKGDPVSILGQFAFSPQCADQDKFISLGSMNATSGTSSLSVNYSPQTICKIPANTPSNIFNFLTSLVDPVDTNGTDGTFNWKCKGISPDGTIDNGGAVTCSAQKIEDAQCGPYANVARTTFDELQPGIRGGPVPDTLNKSYCNVGTAMHQNGSIALDESEFGYFHWECRSKDQLYKSCRAPYDQVKTINFTPSKSSITAGQSVTFNWSLPTNTAFVKCYPVTDYRAQGNSVYDFYNGSKGLQGSYSQVFNVTTVVSLYCTGKSSDIYAQKDIVITVPTAPVTAKTCPSGATNNVKSPKNDNTCNFSWGETNAGKPTSGVSTTGGGVINGICGDDGNWASWSLSCPNKTVVSCAGGGYTFYSNDQSNKCIAYYNQTNAGESVSVGNGLTFESTGPAPSGSASCKADGNWTYMLNCPSKDANVKTCPGGSQQLVAQNGKICVANWGITNANTPVSAQVTNGGTLTATCNANGDWVDIDWKCPN